MILAMDIGNTNIELGIFSQIKEDLNIKASCRYFTKISTTSDEFAFFIFNFLQINQIKAADIHTLIFSSVVPPIDSMIKKMFQDYFTGKIIQVNENIKLNVINCYKNPNEVGSDRLVNACYVSKYYQQNVIIIDMGTATTLCAIDKKGHYLGGIIMPGLMTSLNALIRSAAKLPAITVRKKSKLFSDNTIESVESGIYFSTLYAFEGLITRLSQEVKFDQYLTIATGGIAEIFNEEKIFNIIDDKISLKGLKVIADLNQSDPLE